MCLFVYLASQAPLSEIPYAKGQIFSVTKQKKIPSCLAGFAHVYDISSYEGCGCGFLTDGKTLLDKEEYEQGLASLEALQSYMKEALALESPLTMLASWAGDEEKEAKKADIRNAEFFSFNAEPFDAASSQPHLFTISRA